MKKELVSKGTKISKADISHAIFEVILKGVCHNAIALRLIFNDVFENLIYMFEIHIMEMEALIPIRSRRTLELITFIMSVFYKSM